jgi:hypothetical protein
MSINGGGAVVGSSLLDASNLIVLKVHYWPIRNDRYSLLMLLFDVSCIFCQESSVIHSTANLGVRGQGLLNLSGDGDMIEAPRLILSLFYSIRV